MIPTFSLGIWFGLYESSFWASISILVNPRNLLSKKSKFLQKSVDQILNKNLNAQRQGASYNAKSLLRSGSFDDYVKRMPNLSGIAYGITSTATNIGLAVFPLLYGYINNNPS